VSPETPPALTLIASGADQSLPRLSINEMDELDAVRYEMERILVGTTTPFG
jgi:hypothetical protein